MSKSVDSRSTGLKVECERVGGNSSNVRNMHQEHGKESTSVSANFAPVVRLDSKELRTLKPTRIVSESRLEEVIQAVPDLLGLSLLVIGRQVNLHGRRADLLALDKDCRMYVIELKAGKATRDIVGQVTSYAASVAKMGLEDIKALFTSHSAESNLERAFAEEFGHELPNRLRNDPQVVIVAEALDQETQAALGQLQTWSVPITVVTYLHFRDQNRIYLVRTGWGTSVVPGGHRDPTERILGAVSSLKAYMKNSEGRIREAVEQESCAACSSSKARSAIDVLQEEVNDPDSVRLRSFYSELCSDLDSKFLPTSFLHALYLKWRPKSDGQSTFIGLASPLMFGKKLKGVMSRSGKWQHAHCRWTESLMLEPPLIELAPKWRPPIAGQPVRGYLRLPTEEIQVDQPGVVLKTV